MSQKQSRLCCKCNLASWENIPEWQKDNNFIRTGYRVNNSFSDALWSLFAIHNETINIWTHLLGALLFIGLSVYSQAVTLTGSSLMNRILFFAFCGSATMCFFISAMFHTLLSTNKKIVTIMSRLDYTGIIVFIYTTFSTITYYNFHMHPELLRNYMILFSVVFAFILILINCNEFEKSCYRSLRSIIFTSFGCLMIIPLFHRVIFHEIISHEAHQYLLIELIIILSSVYIYAQRIPERWFIGKFDIYFSSHQILHVLVVIGAILHYMTIVTWTKINH